MKMVGCNIRQFINAVYDRKVFCFGCGDAAVMMLKTLSLYGLEKRIENFVDNNSLKWGNSKNIAGCEISVISPKAMLEKFREGRQKYVILITCMDIKGIYEQLNVYEQLKNVECYSIHIIFGKQFDESNYSGDFKKNDHMLIPKKIHYCWFGKNPIPEQFRIWMDSWKTYCPDYEIIEWNEDNYDITQNKYMRQAYEAKKWGFVPDFARLDIIYNNGGIYLDTDVELIRCLDDLLYQEAFCGLEIQQQVNLGLGFGAVKGHFLVAEMRDYYANKEFLKEDGSPDMTTCITHQNNVLTEYGFRESGEYQNINNMSIYPNDVLNGYNQYLFHNHITENTFSIHHGSLTWMNDNMRRWLEGRRQFLEEERIIEL